MQHSRQRGQNLQRKHRVKEPSVFREERHLEGGVHVGGTQKGRLTIQVGLSRDLDIWQGGFGFASWKGAAVVSPKWRTAWKEVKWGQGSWRDIGGDTAS